MSEKTDEDIERTFEDYWEFYGEFWIEEGSGEAAEDHCLDAWIYVCRPEVIQMVQEKPGYEKTDMDWIKDALTDTKDIDKAVTVLVDLVGELDAPETVHNTPALSAYERNR